MKKLIKRWNKLERYVREIILAYPLLILAAGILQECSSTLHLDNFVNKFLASAVACTICLLLTHAFYSIAQIIAKIIHKVITVR